MANARQKTLRIGIASAAHIRERSLAIARGERRRPPGEPLVWFTSMHALAQVLSESNRRLLELIRSERPATLKDLAALADRQPGNLSRTLKTMETFKLVRLQKSGHTIRPIVDWDRIDIAVPLSEAA